MSTTRITVRLLTEAFVAVCATQFLAQLWAVTVGVKLLEWTLSNTLTANKALLALVNVIMVAPTQMSIVVPLGLLFLRSLIVIRGQ